MMCGIYYTQVSDRKSGVNVGKTGLKEEQVQGKVEKYFLEGLANHLC